ncbi:MAG: ATP-dependent DNA helicase RecG [Planctomycetota bacterium]
MGETVEKPILEREVRYLKGVGPKRASALANLGIETVEDVLFHLPRDYEDRRSPRPVADLEVGETAVVSGRIDAVGFQPRGSRYQGILRVSVRDETSWITLVWFNARPSWKKNFQTGRRITAYGEVKFYDGLQMANPSYTIGSDLQDSDEFGRILPLYPLTEGISQRIMRKIVRRALDEAASEVVDIFPRSFCRRRGLPSAAKALRQVHFPEEMEAARTARRRLSYEELFVFQTALALRRAAVKRREGFSFKVGPTVDRRIRRLFPFDFTDAQNRVIEQVAEDMRRSRPMNRLLQGDVGCGKTVVAVYAMLAALAESSRGYQVALMGPTEILAEQHYLTLESLLERASVRTALLTSSVGAAGRERVRERLAEGELDLVVGTHALIQPSVDFRNLGLVVVDEQHRFGVRQRMALRRKGRPPDVLIMTATPIPRTLALACFSDMDVSVIDEMPPGRASVETELLMPEDWPRAFAGAREELRDGHRAFVIYPLVEENEELELTSAKEGYRELSERRLPEFECCLLHGQMSPDGKREAMEGFRDGRYQVMAATTVVEVGIDVPEATAMIVQHAERLGLAQLHQLRGRIGRGGQEGRCFLLADPSTDQAWQRLKVLTETGDGFRIAEEDLRIRGPGELFGTRQSGMPEFRCYDFSDTEILEQARDDAFKVVGADPELTEPEHALLRRRVVEKYGGRFQLAGVG